MTAAGAGVPAWEMKAPGTGRGQSAHAAQEPCSTECRLQTLRTVNFMSREFHFVLLLKPELSVEEETEHSQTHALRTAPHMAVKQGPVQRKKDRTFSCNFSRVWREAGRQAPLPTCTLCAPGSRVPRSRAPAVVPGRPMRRGGSRPRPSPAPPPLFLALPPCERCGDPPWGARLAAHRAGAGTTQV